MSTQLRLNGSYTRDGDFHQFELPAADLEQLAASLVDASRSRETLELTIGQGRMEFKPVAESVSEASLTDECVLRVTGDSDSLNRLAERLIAMARDNDPDHVGLVHAHLDLLLTRFGPGVSDIVIERGEDATL